ncbi:hypothetical protein ZHAS_00007982 [Anopheles sinensis]|uniref:Uncharacterized protein n=1 Tax=Anopheles sinensis TaxID=74873 RepID=A0A084VR76_ANOSI|nr:hypothetical protein ZHAS_00007982 [Anopheles sinensis]
MLQTPRRTSLRRDAGEALEFVIAADGKMDLIDTRRAGDECLGVGSRGDKVLWGMANKYKYVCVRQ